MKMDKYAGKQCIVRGKEKNNKKIQIAFVALLILFISIAAIKLNKKNAYFGSAFVRMQEEPIKLTQTDAHDPLLILVNSKTPISDEHEISPRLYGNIIIDISIYQELVKMIDDAGETGLTLWVASGYRSVDEQKEIFDDAVQSNQNDGMKKKLAREEAMKTIALPGYSEHHTGLAVDFNTVTPDFAQTNEYLWLKENAASYGFVQRYEKEKENITGIEEEVWHFRYVGTEHAKRMNELNMCLEEYVEFLKAL